MTAQAPLNPQNEVNFKKALNTLDFFLANSKYVAGDSLTLADISILGSLTYAEAFQYDLTPYANVISWQANLKAELPYYEEINQVPAQILRGTVDFLKGKAEENYANSRNGK